MAGAVSGRRRVVPGKTSLGGVMCPQADGSVHVPSWAALGLSLTAQFKGILKWKVRQKGKHLTPTVTFLRKNLVLLTSAHGMLAHSVPLAVRGPFLLFLAAGSPPDPRSSHAWLSKIMAFSKLLLCTDTTDFITTSFWLLVQIPTHSQRQWAVVKKKKEKKWKEKPGQKVLHQPFYSSLIPLSLGTHCICYWRNYDSEADSTDSEHILCTTHRVKP